MLLWRASSAETVMLLRREDMQCDVKVVSEASRVESMGERLPLCASFPPYHNTGVGVQASKQSIS